MRKNIFILSVIFLLLANLLGAAAAKTIVAAADPYPPFVDKEHPKEGLSLEIVREAYKTQGYEVKMEFVPWARAEIGVREGFYDILPDTWFTEKRSEYLLYSEPYGANKIKFIKRKGDSFEYKDLKSLDGKTVGIVRGYGYGDEFLNSKNFKKEETTDIIMNIKKLINSRIDVTLEDEIVASALIKKTEPKLLEKIEFTKGALSVNNLYVTSGIKNPRGKELIEAFNKGFALIKENGTLKNILEEYGLKF